jgi:Trypsin
MTSRSRALPIRSLRLQSRIGVPAIALSLLAVAGCWSSETDPPSASSASASAKELIGGFGASSSQFNAVGSLTVTSSDPFGGLPFPQQVCTGTLIDQDSVLTAKHCIEAVRYSPNATMTFGLGPNSLNPSVSANVIAYQVAPGEAYGGFTGLGHDLAVVHLDAPLADAPTAGLGLIGADDIGAKLATFGFGDQLSFGGQGGLRQVGGVTVQAISGKIYEMLFGDFATFHEWYTGMPVPEECADVPPISFDEPIVLPGDPQSFNCLNTAIARGTYEFTLLEEFDELYVGGAEGDAQPCYGDSGGPLVRTDDSGELRMYGVVSGSVYTADTSQLCGNGAIYAGLSEATIDFVEASAAWEDPCDVETPAGVCDGTVARRCTTLAESGDHTELSFDCASVGSTCQLQSNGVVGCGEDDSSIAPPAIPGGPEAPVPSVQGVFERAFKAPGQGAAAP